MPLINFVPKGSYLYFAPFLRVVFFFFFGYAVFFPAFFFVALLAIEPSFKTVFYHRVEPMVVGRAVLCRPQVKDEYSAPFPWEFAMPSKALVHRVAFLYQALTVQFSNTFCATRKGLNKCLTVLQRTK
jgi:hypothetical protein